MSSNVIPIGGVSGYRGDHWVSVSDETPVYDQDVLAYSVPHHGYAVARLRLSPDGTQSSWFNSTTGQPLVAAPTHWRTLPEPPTQEARSGYESYGNN